jgi:hypothetical protein
MKINKSCYLIVLMLLTFSAVAYSQIVEYRTSKSGNWEDVDVWERKSGSNWVKASGIPSTNINVTIQPQHIINIGANISPNCSSLTVEKGAVLKAEGTATLKVGANKNDGEAYLVNNGTIESGSTAADGLIRVDVFNTAKKIIISGSGNTRFGRLQARGGNPNKLEVIIDTDMTITEKIVTSTFTAMDVLPGRRTNNDDVTFTINKGKTVKIEGSSSFHSAIATAETGGRYVYNILGTLDLSANETTDNVIPVSDNVKGETIVNVAGNLIIAGLFNAVSKSSSGSNDGKVALNVLDGGVVDATKARRLTLGSIQFNTTGTGVVKR